MADDDFPFVEVLNTGSIPVEWAVRKWVFKDGDVNYDWVVEDARGGYHESDETFETLEEAKRNLGVR